MEMAMIKWFEHPKIGELSAGKFQYATPIHNMFVVDSINNLPIVRKTFNKLKGEGLWPLASLSPFNLTAAPHLSEKDYFIILAKDFSFLDPPSKN